MVVGPKCSLRRSTVALSLQKSLLNVPKTCALGWILNHIAALIDEKQVLLILTWSSQMMMVLTHDFSLRIAAHSFGCYHSLVVVVRLGGVAPTYSRKRLVRLA